MSCSSPYASGSMVSIFSIDTSPFWKFSSPDVASVSSSVAPPSSGRISASDTVPSVTSAARAEAGVCASMSPAMSMLISRFQFRFLLICFLLLLCRPDLRRSFCATDPIQDPQRGSCIWFVRIRCCRYRDVVFSSAFRYTPRRPPASEHIKNIFCRICVIICKNDFPNMLRRSHSEKEIKKGNRKNPVSGIFYHLIDVHIANSYPYTGLLTMTGSQHRTAGCVKSLLSWMKNRCAPTLTAEH